MFIRLSGEHQRAVILFLALAASYWCLSPGSTLSQGYAPEELNSGLSVLARTTASIKHRPLPQIQWARHGLIPVLVDLPFIKLGKLTVSPDFGLSFEPGLFTAGLVTLLFLWLQQLCTRGMALFLTMAAAFGTMLWPYAYIGLETQQSFFVFLAGYLVLGREDGRTESWWRTLTLAVACGFAVGTKSTGTLMLPVILFLLYIEYRNRWSSLRSHLIATAVTTCIFWYVAHITTNYYWVAHGGVVKNLRTWLIHSPLQLYSNTVGIVGSPTKGLFVYCPLLLICLYAVPRAWHTHRNIVYFAILVFLGSIGLISIMRVTFDETWGCRYLHTCIAPLVVCVGAAYPHFKWRRDVLVLVLALVGVAISFLGAFYFYGLQDFAATEAGQNTLEWLTGDAIWDHIDFNERLFGTWIEGGSAPAPWTPRHQWDWSPPQGAMTWKTVDLRRYCEPQSFLIRSWNAPKPGSVRYMFSLDLTFAILGPSLLVWVVVLTLREKGNRTLASASPTLTTTADVAGTIPWSRDSQ